MERAEFDELRTVRLLRNLTPAELVRVETWLAAHPEDRVAWGEEEELDDLLDDLPDTCVSSNFTARVWDRIDAEPQMEPAGAGPDLMPWLAALRSLLPKLAGACAVILLAFFLWRREAVRERVETAESLVPVTEVAQLPSVEVLRDFDAIRSLGEPMVGGDLELLAVLEEIR